MVEMMPVKEKGETDTVRISTGLMEGITAFLKTEKARALGLDGKVDVVNYAVRELLKKYKVLS